MSIRIRFDQEKIKKVALENHIISLTLFGSVLRDDFREDSDVDILVRFSSGAKVDLFDLVRIKEDLESIFGRKVDLIEEGTVRNPYRITSINESKELIYAAQG